ncbi:RNA polymerase Rpb4-domain-containing protein [Panaeolus papilionaceus]|nr:RNA polymerase Rpb4-domain-containing protein [Panaeolus papilionaceus]
MEVVNPRAALLSNYEVLTLLKELEADHLSRSKAALKGKKEEGATANGISIAPPSNNPPPPNTPNLEPSENLRTIEVEAIAYLSSDYLPICKQTEKGISKLVKDLAPYSLTKAEKLQIVNLAPTLPVELYVIVEELEDRFQNDIDDILHIVESSLSTRAGNPVAPAPHINGTGAGSVAATTSVTVMEETWDEDGLYEDEYDDTGAGAGIEGELEMDDD